MVRVFYHFFWVLLARSHDWVPTTPRFGGGGVWMGVGGEGAVIFLPLLTGFAVSQSPSLGESKGVWDFGVSDLGLFLQTITHHYIGSPSRVFYFFFYLSGTAFLSINLLSWLFYFPLWCVCFSSRALHSSSLPPGQLINYLCFSFACFVFTLRLGFYPRPSSNTVNHPRFLYFYERLPPRYYFLPKYLLSFLFLIFIIVLLPIFCLPSL